MADLEKQIDAVLAGNTSGGRQARRTGSKPARGGDGSAREGVLLAVGLAAMMGLGLWQVWFGDKKPAKGA